jgi:FKBP-type peptidyl-prolyl cis-trans isomerase FkpA
MKKYLLLFSLLMVSLFSCRKTVTPTFDAAAQAAADDAIIQTYIKANSITAVKDPSGLYYQIIKPGTGAHPNDASNITVGYTCTLTDGTAVETRSSSYFAPLGGLIQGWRIGLNLIGTGGNMILIIPSALAYGTTGQGSIPPNTVIVYNITLQGFN